MKKGIDVKQIQIPHGSANTIEIHAIISGSKAANTISLPTQATSTLANQTLAHDMQSRFSSIQIQKNSSQPYARCGARALSHLAQHPLLDSKTQAIAQTSHSKSPHAKLNKQNIVKLTSQLEQIAQTRAVQTEPDEAQSPLRKGVNLQGFYSEQRKDRPSI